MAIVFKKFDPVDYVRVIKSGRCVKEGTGLSLLYNSLTTNILVIPMTAFDGAFAFDDLTTSDFQSVCVQGALTYVIRDYQKAAEMGDFTYGKKYEEKRSGALNLFCRRINNVIKEIVIREVGKKDVRTLLKEADQMAGFIVDGLKEDETVASLGVQILAVNVLGVTAKPETRKALEAAAREQILKEQDDAIYKRRNAAIEQERLIKENELNTEIQIRRTELEEKIKLEEKNTELVELEVENEKKRAEEQAFAVERMIKAYENVNVALIEACALANMDPGKLMAKAFAELGENAGKIGTLNITPDLLETIAGKKV